MIMKGKPGSKKYRPDEIEEKWQERWEKGRLSHRLDEKSGKSKFYALVEFPYPSGEGLHLGHVFTQTIIDIFARQKRMAGLEVLCPMGWDAFGLPTENFAIKTGIQPAVATQRNTNRFRAQIKRLGMAFSWEREINTTDPDYYHWTQWIFIQFFKCGLAYKAEMPVGWCPACKIILANEEIVGGKCERCGAQAEYRRQRQWVLRITAYADRLADELDLVDYPEYVKKSQRDWIGRSEGIIVDYPLLENSRPTNQFISCYTTRPDTNFGATFIVVAPEHPLLPRLVTTENKEKVEAYCNQAKKKSEMDRVDPSREKTGVFTGSYALNRATGRRLPVFVSDFVVLTSGTGMVVGVPAHDQRDWDFARKYHLDIMPVIKPEKGEWDYDKSPYLETDKSVVFNSDFLNGLTVKEAIRKITEVYVKRGWGRKARNYHLRDWIFSRQHYWGEPIPMVWCRNCHQKGISWWETDEYQESRQKYSAFQGFIQKTKGDKEMAGWFPLPESELPLKLPEVEKYQPTDTGESPLANIKSFVNTRCPHCGGRAQRETDTMPNWAGSSWYYLAYCFADKLKAFGTEGEKKISPAGGAETPTIFSLMKERLDYWLPVDLYLGGAEHTTLHLLYSRFWHKFLNDIGVVPGREPYAARRQHGVILGPDGNRMSKSRGNVINPEDIINKYGADTLRCYLMFMGPYDSTMPWSDEGVEGIWRFLNRVWRLTQSVSEKTASAVVDPPASEEKAAEDLEKLAHRTTKKVTEDIGQLKFNTALAAIMEYVGALNRQKDKVTPSLIETLLLLLAPFAPYMTEELWQSLRGRGAGKKFVVAGSIHSQQWPSYSSALAAAEEKTIVVQINGRVRSQMILTSQRAASQSEVTRLAKNDPKIKKYLVGKTIHKTIFVPGRLVNFVI